MRQVARLKSSRDRLLEQVDRQWEELDRSGAEGRALAEDVSRARAEAAAWEAQAQDALAQVERLKEGRGMGGWGRSDTRPQRGQRGCRSWARGGC